jgi:hypothetical protein
MRGWHQLAVDPHTDPTAADTSRVSAITPSSPSTAQLGQQRIRARRHIKHRMDSRPVSPVRTKCARARSPSAKLTESTKERLSRAGSRRCVL